MAPRQAPRLPPITRTVAWMLGIYVAVYLVVLFGGERVRAGVGLALVLHPADLLRGEVWKLGTTALVATSGLGFLFDALVLWLFLPVIEERLGRRRFLRFAVVALLVGNLAAALVGLALGGGHQLGVIGGLAPLLYAAIVAFGVAFGEARVQLLGAIPMSGKALAIGVLVLVLLFTLLEASWVSGAGFLAAMAVGYVVGGGRTPLAAWRRWQARRARRRFGVIEGDRRGPRWMN